MPKVSTRPPAEVTRYTVVLAHPDWIECQPSEAVVIVRVSAIGPDEARRAARLIAIGALEASGDGYDPTDPEEWPCMAVLRGRPRNETPYWMGVELDERGKRI